MIIGIQTSSYPKPSSLHAKKLPLKWWNVIALVYLHLFSLKTVLAMFLTDGGLGFWMQLSTFLKSSFATVCADVYVMKRNKMHTLIRRISKLFGTITFDNKRKYLNAASKVLLY
ncbi:hypothetical protein JTE90_017735 [Oedothorax gibbosus]|uniref:Uncharacterized protein n=1 Tax=Oedothorax gibbosus TaxID=931172 RepID=A0AAV6UC46_9ARAC|nr:hypothetical protein JTE90_017735 [Oedothorax gibbosus]